MEEKSGRARSYAADIHDRVARIYYSHGLFCSSHPYFVIGTTLLLSLLCCYPLIHVSLLGSSSQYFSVPVQDFGSSNLLPDSPESYKFIRPRWLQGSSVGFVQQVVVKSALFPWRQDLILTDAFRVPLTFAFVITELIRNHQMNPGSLNATSLQDLCLQVSEPIDKLTANLLPQYNCLIISPSNIWRNDLSSFKDDPNIIKTIFGTKDSSVERSALREIMFGIPFKETGIKKLFLRNRPRIISFAITVILRNYSADFIKSLSSHLRTSFPTYPYTESVNQTPEEIVHVHFQDLHSLVDFVPLVAAYVILFLYIYFSVHKIELVKSKWGLAISAVMTVVMSLLMSFGLCLWFGLSPTLSGSEILPYLIVVIGLENMLVLTKSVVSTPMHLDVKLRVAQGLSKEGWSITKNLLTELALLMVAFLTFVPKIQEFCLFAAVGLLTDFFLQLVFFATFLSVDIRRMEVSDLQRNCIREVTGSLPEDNRVHRTSQHRLGDMRHMNGGIKSSSTRIFAPPATPILVKLPKRIKFIYFWARTRMVQRALMVCLVMWIFFLVHSSGFVDRYIGISTTVSRAASESASNGSDRATAPLHVPDIAWNCSDQTVARNVEQRLKHHDPNLWQSLHSHHWTTLFGYYNISLSGRFISVLPPIHLSVLADPNNALEMRNPNDFDISKKSYWQILSSGEVTDADLDDLLSRDLPYYPSSPGEVAVAVALAVPSLLFVVYLMVVLYRCMCSKHYAEWRSSWTGSSERPTADNGRCSGELVMDTLPLKLSGHTQEIEFLCADSSLVLSCCLDGNINVWDSISGERLTSIVRSKPPEKASPNMSHDSFSSNSSSPSESGVFHFNRTSGLETSPTFPKHFSFDKYSTPITSKNGKKYDFEQFAIVDNSVSSPNRFDNGLFSGTSYHQNLSPEPTSLLNFNQSADKVWKPSLDKAEGRSNSVPTMKSVKSKRENSSEQFRKFDRLPSSPLPISETNHNTNILLKDCLKNVSTIRFYDEASLKPEFKNRGHMRTGSDTSVQLQQVNSVFSESSKKPRAYRDLEEGLPSYSERYMYQRQTEHGGAQTVLSLLPPQAVWSMAHCGPCLALGCKDGRIELWNAFTGALEFVYDECKSGVSSLCVTADRLVAARVSGFLDFFAINIFVQDFSYRCSSGGISDRETDGIRCMWMQSIKAHSLAVSALRADAGLVLSGGYDRLVKVYRSDTGLCMYTLHGHTSGISVLSIDQFSPPGAASGCSGGQVCVWDVGTGTCVYSVRAHSGPVAALLPTEAYLISQGADNRCCIWEKSQGHLLHTIHQDFNLHCNVLLLTNNIIVTTKEDHLVLWDVNHGEALRMILVGNGDHATHVRMLRRSGHAVVCDYGRNILVVSFPAISDKSE